jgi:hypothetical protein
VSDMHRFPPVVRRTLNLLRLPPDESGQDLSPEATVKQGGQSGHTVRRASSNVIQIELSITEVTLPLAPNSSILNKGHTHRL